METVKTTSSHESVLIPGKEKQGMRQQEHI
jgi:hypothetical protein